MRWASGWRTREKRRGPSGSPCCTPAMLHSSSNPDKIMLKVDFSNAFNMVDRTEMLKQAQEKLPGIYKWTEYCYSHPALLWPGVLAKLFDQPPDCVDGSFTSSLRSNPDLE